MRVEADSIGQRAVSRILRRLIPFLCLLFVVNYLDRTNVAMARLTMLEDLKLGEREYGLGAGLFFIGYCIFELPSNLILRRVGARRWIARIMITWGIFSSAMMLTRGKYSFYSLRFMVGLAEAGFLPGVVFYLTAWVPASRRTQAISLFMTSTAISGVIGNPLAGLIMKMEGIAGLHGWQWLFLLEGIPPLLLGIAILILPILPDRPAEAAWLSDEEKNWIETTLASDGSARNVRHVDELRAAVGQWRLWYFSAIYFLLIVGLYGFIFWVPAILKSVGAGSDQRIGMLSAGPYLLAAVTMVVIGAAADRCRQRRWIVAGCAAVGAVGVAMLAGSHQTSPAMWAMSVAAVGIFGMLSPFWVIPSRFLRDRAAAGGIAIINSAGAMSGYVTPLVIGWTRDVTGRFTIGLLLVAAALALGAAMMLFVPADSDAAA